MAPVRTESQARDPDPPLARDSPPRLTNKLTYSQPGGWGASQFVGERQVESSPNSKYTNFPTGLSPAVDM